ncbi:hypothetical protein [Piscinibacterium candidicorallinum]|uniref:J domain-containing protein n=1 Tax=Piscinibacterium candidicorallinum TaxID=1793872 RepID=A0ABV7H5Y9_9BURK
MWDELGIEVTADESTIRRAYARKLKALGRTPDPERFAALRAAYEQALWDAQQPRGVADADAPAAAKPHDATNAPIANAPVPDTVADDSPRIVHAALASPVRPGDIDDHATQDGDAFPDTVPLALLDLEGVAQAEPADLQATYDVAFELGKRAPQDIEDELTRLLGEPRLFAIEARNAFEAGVADGVLAGEASAEMVQRVLDYFGWKPVLNARTRADAQIAWLYERIDILKAWQALQDLRRTQPLLGDMLAGKRPQDFGWQRWSGALRQRVQWVFHNINSAELIDATRHPAFPHDTFKLWHDWLQTPVYWPSHVVGALIFGGYMTLSFGAEFVARLGIPPGWTAAQLEDQLVSWPVFALCAALSLGLALGFTRLHQRLDPPEAVRLHGTGPRYAKLFGIASSAFVIWLLAASFMMPAGWQWVLVPLGVAVSWMAWPMLGLRLGSISTVLAACVLGLPAGIGLAGLMLTEPAPLFGICLMPVLAVWIMQGKALMLRSEQVPAELVRAVSIIAALGLVLLLIGSNEWSSQLNPVARAALDAAVIAALAGLSADVIVTLLGAFSSQLLGTVLAALAVIGVVAFGIGTAASSAHDSGRSTLLTEHPLWGIGVGVLVALHLWQAFRAHRYLTAQQSGS